ncbi:hypothetical protein TNCV_4484051 [Trichonephila clavipes]|nr:hypothetical protein TNCV_4484051 [Trichonephila clavipes]
MKDEGWKNRNIQYKHRRRFITNFDPNMEQKECASFHSRREAILGQSPTSFPEDTSMPYSGFKPEPTRFQAEGHIHHTVWLAKVRYKAYSMVQGHLAGVMKCYKAFIKIIETETENLHGKYLPLQPK